MKHITLFILTLYLSKLREPLQMLSVQLFCNVFNLNECIYYRKVNCKTESARMFYVFYVFMCFINVVLMIQYTSVFRDAPVRIPLR